MRFLPKISSEIEIPKASGQSPVPPSKAGSDMGLSKTTLSITPTEAVVMPAPPLASATRIASAIRIADIPLSASMPAASSTIDMMKVVELLIKDKEDKNNLKIDRSRRA